MIVSDTVAATAATAIGLGWVGWVSGSLMVLLRKVTRIETLLNGRRRKQ
jgi:hypothetical protein